MAWAVFIAAVIGLNLLLHKKNKLSLKSAGFSIAIAIVVSIFTQLAGFFSLGHLDPFFLIAFFIQISIGSILGVALIFLKERFS